MRRRHGEAVSGWFQQHKDAVYAFVMSRNGGDPDAAADIVQDTFATALGRIDDFDPDRGAMLTWLIFLARNQIRTAHRRMRTAVTPESAEGEISSWAIDLATEPLPDELIERREMAALVQAAIAALPHRDRWALTEHYWRERPLSELAVEVGLTINGVKSLLHRARRRFRLAYLHVAAGVGGRLEDQETEP